MKVSELLDLLEKHNTLTGEYLSIELFADGSGYVKLENMNGSVYIFPTIEDLVNYLKTNV